TSVEMSDAGEYRYEVTSTDGCYSEFTFTLNVNPLPAFTFAVNGVEVGEGGSATVCEGDEVELEITDANVTGTFDMYLNDELVQSGLPFGNGTYPFDASLAAAGDYRFVVTSEDGCVSEFAYTLHVHELPT